MLEKIEIGNISFAAWVSALRNGKRIFQSRRTIDGAKWPKWKIQCKTFMSTRTWCFL